MHKKILFYISAVIAIYLLFLFSPNNKILNNFKIEAGGGCINNNAPILNIQNNTLNPSQLYATYRTPSTYVINNNKYAVCVKNYDRVEHTLVAKDGKWSKKICSSSSLSCVDNLYLDTEGSHKYYLQELPSVTGVIIAGNANTTPQTPTPQVITTPIPSPTKLQNSPAITSDNEVSDIAKNLSLDRAEDDLLTKKPYSDTKILGLTLSYQVQMVIMAALIIIILTGFGLYIIFRRK